MITTLRWRLIAVPAHLVRHARGLALRLPPGDNHLLAEVLGRLQAPPHPVLTRPIPAPTTTGTRAPEATLGPSRCPTPQPATRPTSTQRHQDS